MMTKAKAVGHYVNSILANQEVRRVGYDEALMLDTDGYVSEASGENLFIVRDGIVKTPPLTSVLPGITRATLMTLLRERGHTVVEERFTRDEVYIADEAFFTGTAAEVTPVRELDDRPIVFLGEGEMGLHATTNPVRVAIAVWPWGSYLGDEGVKHGIRVKTSSFQRFHVNTMMTKAKAVGHYVNSILANQEVRRVGYDEALMLDTDGYVSEASGENLFIVRDGVVKTPPLTSVLPGITRATLMTLLRERGHTVVEERFTRDEVYIADEAFFTGTAAEVTPVRELDDRPIGAGKPGPVTTAMQEAYFALVRGGDPRHRDWLAFV